MPNYYINRKIMEGFLKWLLDHESDIADSINDFGELQDIFEVLHGRKVDKKANEGKE